MSEGRLSNRQEWLKAIGFELDPFLPESFRAETDPLFMPSELLSYVDRKDSDLLTGVVSDFDNPDLDNPGYHFIFSQPGGGKTSLRKRIHLAYDNAGLFESAPQVLIIDYTDHSYSLKESEAHHHVNRIIRLAEKNIGIDLHQEKLLVDKSPILALEKLVKTCRKRGVLRIYILVDDLDAQSLQKIESLAEITELFKIKGLIVKFFFPENLLLLAQSVLPFSDFPPYILTWESNELSQILNQRLIACLNPGYLSTTSVHPISFLVDGYLAATIEDSLVRLGELGNSPRLMWQLGNYLLDEHINNITPRTMDLINYEVFARARLRLFDDLISSGMIIGYKFDGRLAFERKSAVKVPTGSKQKATIFLCYAEKDWELIIDGDGKSGSLYEELQAKNFKPWMRKDIFPGEDPNVAIKSAINKSDFFLLCLSSKSSKERGFYQKELKWALEIQSGMNENDIYIIPVRIEKCNPPDELKQWHVDWFIESQRVRLFNALEEGKIRRRRKK